MLKNAEWKEVRLLLGDRLVRLEASDKELDAKVAKLDHKVDKIADVVNGIDKKMVRVNTIIAIASAAAGLLAGMLL